MSKNLTDIGRFRCYEQVPYFILTDAARINFFVIAIVDFLVAIPAIILNAAFLYTTYRHPRFRKNISNMLLINLAFLDLVLSAVNIPMHGLQMVLYSASHSVCGLTKFNDFTSFAFSTPVFANLLFITFDTYCGVVFPFFYRQTITPSKILSAMWLSWILLIVAMIICNVLPLWTFYTILFFILVSLAVVFFVVAYFHIYLSVSRIHRRISCASVSSTKSQQKSGMDKTLKISIFIVSFFVLSFLPCGAYSLFNGTGIETETIRTFVFPWTYTLRLSSSLANAFIYYWRLSDVRAATLKLLPECCQTPIDYKAKKESYLRKISIAHPNNVSEERCHSHSDDSFQTKPPSSSIDGDGGVIGQHSLNQINANVKETIDMVTSLPVQQTNDHKQKKKPKKKVSIVEPNRAW